MQGSPGSDARQPSAVEWLARLDRRELSARELTQHYVERAEEANERLNALAAFDPEAALSAADAADAARARGERRPLLGLPLTVKDSLEVAGLPATGGSLARADHVPERDATVVRRLREAGAIVLAKTNLPEYSSSYETDNLIHGRTLHPLDPERTPGGSSGGEAALAAADATPLGLGTDGGGSIRVPAHYCGVFGLRPTVGRVPMTGNWPATRASGYGDLYCAGPIARYVEDLARMLPLIAGPDRVDPYAVPAPLAGGALDRGALPAPLAGPRVEARALPAPLAGGAHDRGALPAPLTGDRVEAGALSARLAGERLDPGVLRVGWFARSPRVAVTPGTEAAVAAATRSLADAGASVQPVEPPWDPDPTELFMTAVVADGGAQARADVARADGRHHPEFQAFLDAAAERALSAEEWFAVQRDIFELRAAMRRLLDGLDLLVCPVAAGPAPRHGQDYGRYHAFDFVHLIALAGLPAASVPVGSEDGLPVGVQVVGPPFREDLVLAGARLLEAAPIAATEVAT